MIHILFASAFIALSVPGIVAAVRALPPVERLVMEGKKPWACDICSCFWVASLVTLLVAGFLWDPWALLGAGPGYTGALLVLRLVQAPQSAPPPLE